MKFQFSYFRGSYQKTMVLISLEDRELYGEAFCHPKDQFVKEIGRKVAIKDAISHLSKATRKKVWEAYFNRKVQN